MSQWRATAARLKLNVVVLDSDGTIAHLGRHHRALGVASTLTTVGYRAHPRRWPVVTRVDRHRNLDA